MDESHEGYKLLRGVRHDIKTLLTNFELTGSVRFTDFCEEWKGMKFSLIFRERKSLLELLEFCEEIIHITKGYLEPPWNFHIRVGALFTLYGLYFKQPVKRAAKIRFVKDEWGHLSQFIEECKKAKHYDVCFIHYKLYLHGAYVFTAVPRATGLERGFRKYELKCKVNKNTIGNTIGETILKRPNIVEPEMLDSLAALESVYSEKKSQILGKKNLEFVDKDFSNRLKMKLDNFNVKIQQEFPTRTAEESLQMSLELSADNDSADEEPNTSEGTSRKQNKSGEKKFETIYEKEMKMQREGRSRSVKRAKVQVPDRSDLPDL